MAAPASLRRLAPSDYATMPWRNGGGTTHEIAIRTESGHEPRSGEDFLWRLSIAEVASSGPFSAFPGLCRILTVIEGKGIHLVQTAGGDLLEALPLDPTVFDGGTAVSGELIAGPIRDLNVIFDPGAFSATVTRLQEATELSNREGREQALIVVSGSVAVEGGEPLGADETLLLLAGEPASARVTPETSETVALLVTLKPRD